MAGVRLRVQALQNSVGLGEGSNHANERSVAYTGTDPINTHTRRIIGTKFVTVKER